jgi:chemotaxis signal transduction protein
VAEPDEPQGELPDEDADASPVLPRALNLAGMERLLSHIAQGTDPTEGRTGSEYLLFTCGQTRCAVPLPELREVLPALPAAVPLPFSPPWLLGVFPLRTELLGLVDPAPILLGDGAQQGPGAPQPTTALIAGEGDDLLGLAVSGIGDIALVQPEEILHDPTLDTPHVALPYAAGHYTPAAGGQPHAVVHLPRLVGDLLRALTEAAANE